jgi:hypothetical protein
MRGEIADGLLDAIFIESEVALIKTGDWMVALSDDNIDDDEA